MLVTTDLHLTESLKNEYRWDIFPWLLQEMRNGGHDELAILGDLTDSKDGHNSVLVNRIVSNLVEFIKAGFHLIILKGNHDYIDPELPYFFFLRHLDNVTYVVDPTEVHTSVGTVLCLPHDRKPFAVWERLRPTTDWIFCHQTFNGAKSHNGQELQSDVPPTFFSNKGYEGFVLSGDIHTAQDLKDIIYVGTPYPVHFGEVHKPRVLSLSVTEGVHEIDELYPPSIRKLSLTINDPSELPEFKPGDQVKIKLELGREEFADWDQHRRKIEALCTDKNVKIHSLELRDRSPKKDTFTPKAKSVAPEHVLGDFCLARELTPEEQQAAEDVLDEMED